MNENQEFSVGDYVVYPSHGVGEIKAQEFQEIGGQKISLLVIHFESSDMTLRIPVKRASNVGLRHLNSKDYLEKVCNILSLKPKVSKGMWSRKAQEYETKINSGDIILIAEVVRDLHKNVDDPDRSYSERVIYESALSRLTNEFAAIKKVEPSKALDYILETLEDKVAA